MCFGGDSIRRGPGAPGSGGSLPPATLQGMLQCRKEKDEALKSKLLGCAI